MPDVGGDVLGALDHLLASTSSVVIATGILNIWMHTAAEVGDWRAGLDDADRDRLLLGIGISHAADRRAAGDVVGASTGHDPGLPRRHGRGRHPGRRPVRRR